MNKSIIVPTKGLCIKEEIRVIDKHTKGSIVTDIFISEDRRTMPYRMINPVLYFNQCFFIDPSMNFSLCTVKKPFEEKELLIKGPISNLILVGDTLYYLKTNTHQLIARSIHGKEKNLLKDHIQKFYWQEDALIIQDKDGLSKYVLASGKHNQLLEGEIITIMPLDKDIIIWMNPNKPKPYIFLNGSLESLDYKPIEAIHHNGCTYYTDKEDHQTLYLWHMEKNSTTRLYGQTCKNLSIFDNIVYFKVEEQWKSMDLDSLLVKGIDNG